MKSTQRYKELIHIKIVLRISIGQQLSDDCIFAADSCAMETTAGLQMCWDLPDNRLRSSWPNQPQIIARGGENNTGLGQSFVALGGWGINPVDRKRTSWMQGLFLMECVTFLLCL